MSDRLAILGGEPVRSKPFAGHPIGSKERQAVLEVLESGILSGFPYDFMGGPKVQAFEQQFADRFEIQHAVAVNSGTAALHTALAASGVKAGDEVVVPCYTFTATSTAVLHQNAIPVFADVDPKTFCLTAQTIEAALTGRTRAVIAVHLLGNVCRMDEILELTRKRGLILIEDNAQSPGAQWKEEWAGTFADAGTFSFVETKNIVTGEGGMVVTNHNEIAKRCRLLRNHGECHVADQPRSYQAEILGWNYRMTELEAAIGIAQMSQFDAWTQQRIANAEYLNAHLKLPGLTTPHKDPDVRHVYHLYPLLYDEAVIGVSRLRFQQALAAEGVPFTLGYPHPLYRNPLFQEGMGGHRTIDYRNIRLRVAEDLCSRSLWTHGIRPPAAQEELNDLIRALEKVYEGRHQMGSGSFSGAEAGELRKSARQIFSA